MDDNRTCPPGKRDNTKEGNERKRVERLLEQSATWPEICVRESDKINCQKNVTYQVGLFTGFLIT